MTVCCTGVIIFAIAVVIVLVFETPGSPPAHRPHPNVQNQLCKGGSLLDQTCASTQDKNN